MPPPARTSARALRILTKNGIAIQQTLQGEAVAAIRLHLPLPSCRGWYAIHARSAVPPLVMTLLTRALPMTDLLHFCWRERSVPADQPELDLTMIPGDGTFIPVEPSSSTPASAKANGRIFVLKFESSSTRHLFWLQSHSQSTSGDPTWLSPRDRKIGEIVNRLLQGDEVDVNAELAAARNGGGDGGRDDDGDESMEDVEGHGDEHHEAGTGGAGADATGGDVREEGSGAREGGGDGARA